MAKTPKSAEPAPKPNKRIVIVTSDKGGSGKTTFSRAIADHWRRQPGLSAFLSDADGEVGQLLQFYGSTDSNGDLAKDQDGLKGVHYFDAKQAEQREHIFDGIDSNADRILIDMPGGSFALLQEINDVFKFFATDARSGYAVTLVDVITPMIASARTVATMISKFGEQQNISFVVVKNGFFGPTVAPPDKSDWVIYDESEARKMLTERGGIELVMPGMRGRTYSLIDRYNLGFTAAGTAPQLKTADKSVAFGWMLLVDELLEGAAGVI